eukprot:gene8276-9125_t
MASPLAREWSVQYESLKRKISYLRINSNGFPPEEVSSIATTLQTLDGQLKVMTASPLQYEIPASELARRQVLIDNLKKFMVTSGSSTRAPAMASSPKNNGSASSSSTYNPVTTSDRALVQRQQEVIKLQDTVLLDIERGVDRLHQQALQIGDETKAQVHLLDDLDSNVDIASAALQAEAKHTERIKDKAQMCYMYICVAVEILILFLLIVVMFAA